VIDLLLEISRQEGATLLTVTHDHAILGRFDRIVDFENLGGDA
jgi:predicted ABC-type transport system involved in lysophospholipase L1 biosynthesis ATPase subunit